MARGIASLPQTPWQSAEGLSRDINTEKEFNKFQIRANEPTARAAEQKVFNDYRSQGLYPWNLNSRPEVDWSDGKQDILGWQVRPGNIERINPVTNAGITHQDLSGYKVMPAGGSKWNPRYWWQGLSDREHGTNFAQEYLMGEEGMARANREFNKFQINANEPDARDQQLWLYNQAREENKQPLFFDTVPAPDDPDEDWIHRMQYFDVPETLQAQSQWRKPENMEKTIEALKLRPEFEGWTDEAIKNWIYNTARASRGGIIGLI